MKNLPYDPVKDFKPVSGLFRGQAEFVVPGSSKFRTLQELIVAAMQKVLDTREAKEFVLKHGGEQMPLGPEGMAKFHLAEYERMERIARAAGVKPE